tara:strand:- start:274 stop:534 length:261 start_codon:yes stop_codon:yes gene_type:complete
MTLTIKKGRRNLQEIYDIINDTYRSGSLEEMRNISKEFVTEMRVEKYKGRGFINTIDKIKDKVKLLTLMTNLHMQDSRETSGLSKI